MTAAVVGAVCVVLALVARDVAVRLLADRAASRDAGALGALQAEVGALRALVGEPAGEGQLGRRVLALERAAAGRVRR